MPLDPQQIIRIVEGCSDPLAAGRRSQFQAMRQEGVPQGTVTKGVWHSRVFPETVRDYWVYVPKQYDGTKPACVMVFQDGIVYAKETGDFRVPVVLDNLVHKQEMPVTIGIFINPGHEGEQSPQKPFAGSNRSFEYNTLSDQYARFLLDEILRENRCP